MSEFQPPDNPGAGAPNRLLAAASPLLNAIAHFRYAPAPDSTAALRQQMVGEVRRFEQSCQDLGIDAQVIVRARYCLCTSLDEAAALTPWGQDSIWAGNGLLVAFHNEAGGGEKFFQLMAMLLRQPDRHIDLLELIYFCLLLGFGGRYRVMENGIYRLEIVTQRLAQQLRRLRGEYPPSLSDLPPAPPPPRRSPRGRLALLVGALVCAITWCSLYIGLNARLDSTGDRVAKRMYSLPLPKPLPKAAVFSLSTLRQLLALELATKKISLSVAGEQVTLTLRGGDVFDSASARLDPTYVTAIRRIAGQVALTSGAVLVRGHSDSQKIVTGEYSSNQALAKARAESAAWVLRQVLPQPARVITESAVGAPPLVPDTSAKNRAINRRIDIVFSLSPQTTL